MPRIELRVPYQEKNHAKRLGARWDAQARVWFVPEDLDPTRFQRWWPPVPEPNVRGPAYFLAASASRCWRCSVRSRVHGFILPAGHETLFDDDESDDWTWELAEEPSILCYVDWLAPAVAQRVAALTPHYRIGHSRLTGSQYWMNHCDHCGAEFDDHETFCEPGQGFLAFTREDAQRVELQHVAEAFAASCGSYSIGVTLFDEMRRT
ncbi:MAG: conjugal transfer protein TraC [Proteobacteria bacterium]|nr:conjugal transfer protein TraC [Pseudomonadota bacterium]